MADAEECAKVAGRVLGEDRGPGAYYWFESASTLSRRYQPSYFSTRELHDENFLHFDLETIHVLIHHLCIGKYEESHHGADFEPAGCDGRSWNDLYDDNYFQLSV
jgi:hypothetical protein